MSIINISLVGLVEAQSYKADILVSHIPEADSGVAKLSGRFLSTPMRGSDKYIFIHL